MWIDLPLQKTLLLMLIEMVLQLELLSDRNNLFLHSLTCSSKECKDGDGGVYMHGAVSELKTSGCGEWARGRDGNSSIC